MHYSLSRATIWNLLGYLYLIIASLVSTPVLISGLGVAGFGQYSLVLASTILVSALNFGLPQAVTRSLAQDRGYSLARRSLWATSSSLFILSGLLGGTAAVIITALLHLSPIILAMVFAICLMNNLVSHYSTLPQAEGHFGYFNAKTFIVGTGNTLLAAYLAYHGAGITTILLGQLATYLLILFVLAYFSLKFFPQPWTGQATIPIAKRLLTFGLKNQLGTLVGQVQGNYAKYLLSGVSGPTLSAFVIAQGLVQKLAGAVSQVASALYPAASHSSVRSIYHRLQLSLFFISLLGVGSYNLLGFAFLSWWLHNIQLVAMVDQIMRVFVWYFVILVLTPLASTILDSHGRPELTSFFALLTTGIEIALALYLYPRLGLMAPVYAGLIALIMTTPALLIRTEQVMLK